jgi:2-polyprenyl-3-methyl-5-hydroxy-6-metoxy-1,4-benzoquinol methylase
MVIRIAGGVTEQGVVIGNAYDKYGSNNPIVRLLMRGFETELQSLVKASGESVLHEIGCGEGYWTIRWARQGLTVRGSDFSEVAVSLARENGALQGVDVPFSV